MNHKFQDANFNAKDTRYKIQDSRRGFTMVELVLVVGVLVVLSAVVLVTLNVPQYRGQAHNVQRKNDIKTVHNAFLLMARDKDDYTTGLPTSPTCIGTGSAGAFNLKGISWTANPSSTAMKFNVRACTDATCSTDPSWLLPYTDYNSPASIDIPNASFFQYKAAFNNVSDSAWTQGALGDPFDGTNASTMVNAGSVKLNALIDGGTGSDGSIDVSLGTANGGCTKTGSDASGGAGLTRSGTSWAGSTCTIDTTTKATWNFTTVNIPSTYILTTSVATGGLTIKATGNVTINGSIALNAKGCAGGAGGGVNAYGAGSGSCTLLGTGAGIYGNNYGGTGGGHGGNGGKDALSLFLGGGPYDSTSSPVLVGSGGGAADFPGGNGGGAVKIITPGTVTVNGSITANGDVGVGGFGSTDDTSGGGSGGSIWIQANTLAGSAGGVITANGGHGGDHGYTGSLGTPYSGAGGSGGMIALYYNLSTYGGTTPSSSGGAAGLHPATSGGQSYPGDNVAVYYGGSNFIDTKYATSGTYTSSVKDLNQSANFTSISWNRTDANDGEIILGDTNLKGLWHFNEGSSTPVKDSAGSNAGTMNSAGWGTPGKFGSSSFLDNGSKYVTINDNNALDIGTGDWSAEAWFKLSGTGIRTIISKDDLYDIKVNNSNQVVAGVYDPADTDQVTATSTPINDTTNWHHAALVFSKSAGRVNLYVDGKLDGTAAISPSALPSDMSNSANLRIGADGVGANAFSGNIDEVAFWSKALTAPTSDCATNEPKISYDSYQYEICQHYNKGIGIPHLKFQARSCNDALCDTEIFIGPDGTANTYYNSLGSNGSNSTLNLTANQWVQYKADFATSDTSQTPSLDSISIRYNTSEISKPKLEDITITASLDSAGKNQVGLLYSGYGDFVGAGIKTCSTNPALSCLVDGDCPGGGSGSCQSKINPLDSLKILPEGSIEYQGGLVPTYTSPIFSTQCFDIGPVLVPEYLPIVPKDPKIGTDQNTGYFFSANSEMGTVTISAPAAELGEVIRN